MSINFIVVPLYIMCHFFFMLSRFSVFQYFDSDVSRCGSLIFIHEFTWHFGSITFFHQVWEVFHLFLKKKNLWHFFSILSFCDPHDTPVVHQMSYKSLGPFNSFLFLDNFYVILLIFFFCYLQSITKPI